MVSYNTGGLFLEDQACNPGPGENDHPDQVAPEQASLSSRVLLVTKWAMRGLGDERLDLVVAVDIEF